MFCTWFEIFWLGFRGRSRSRSHSPSFSRSRSHGSYERGGELESSSRRSRSKGSVTTKIEYITEFGSTTEPTVGIGPPSSPTQLDFSINRSEHWPFKTCNDHNLASLFAQMELLHLVPQGRCLGGLGVGWA